MFFPDDSNPVFSLPSSEEDYATPTVLFWPKYPGGNCICLLPLGVAVMMVYSYGRRGHMLLVFVGNKHCGFVKRIILVIRLCPMYVLAFAPRPCDVLLDAYVEGERAFASDNDELFLK